MISPEEVQIHSYVDEYIHKVSQETDDLTFRDGFKQGYNKAIDDVMAKAKEIQEEQIENLEHSPIRNGKQWAIYMNTYLGHIQVACKKLIAERLKDAMTD